MSNEVQSSECSSVLTEDSTVGIDEVPSVRQHASKFEAQIKMRELIWRGRQRGVDKDTARIECVFWPFALDHRNRPVHALEGRVIHAQDALRYLAMRTRFKSIKWRISEAVIAEHRALCHDKRNCLNVYHIDWDWDRRAEILGKLRGPKAISQTELRKYDWIR